MIRGPLVDASYWGGAVAGLLFVAIFGLRVAVADPESAILLLCVIPTALVAVEFGSAEGCSRRC